MGYPPGGQLPRSVARGARALGPGHHRCAVTGDVARHWILSALMYPEFDSRAVQPTIVGVPVHLAEYLTV